MFAEFAQQEEDQPPLYAYENTRETVPYSGKWYHSEHLLQSSADGAPRQSGLYKVQKIHKTTLSGFLRRRKVTAVAVQTLKVSEAWTHLRQFVVHHMTHWEGHQAELIRGSEQLEIDK